MRGSRSIIKTVIILAVAALIATAASLLRHVPPVVRNGANTLIGADPFDKSPIYYPDFIQLRVYPGLSPYYPYYVKIYGDGRVERDTVGHMGFDDVGCPLPIADRRFRIADSTASQLLIRARDGGFGKIPEKLSSGPGDPIVLDAGGYSMTLQLGGVQHHVGRESLSSSPLLTEISESMRRISPMDELANTGKYNPQRKAECDAFERYGASTSIPAH